MSAHYFRHTCATHSTYLMVIAVLQRCKIKMNELTLLPNPGPGGNLDTDLEGRDDETDEAAVFAGIQGAVGCPAFGARCDA